MQYMVNQLQSDYSSRPHTFRSSIRRLSWPLAVAVALAIVASSTQYVSAAIVYNNRVTFQAALGTSFTDDFSDPGYSQNFTNSTTSFYFHNEPTFSAVKGEVYYDATAFNNLWFYYYSGGNIGTVCTGCNGSFRLDLTGTSVGTTDGVFGIGLDLRSFGYTDGTPTSPGMNTAFVTYGDGTTENISLLGFSSGGFFGLTDSRLISSVHFGQPNGAVSYSGGMRFDNVTIGSALILLELSTDSNSTPIQPGGSTSLSYGNGRIGANTLMNVTLDNGSGNTVTGTFGQPTSGDFTGGPSNFTLGGSSIQGFSYGFNPSTRGFKSGSTQITTSDGDFTVNLSGTAVGPEFSSNYGTSGMIDLGETTGSSVSSGLSLTNNTPDADLGSLTDLTIKSFSITGPDAAAFELADNGLNSLGQSGSLNEVLGKGETLDLNVIFNPGAASGVGTMSATLNILTDQNAAFGADGAVFSFDLTGTVVPEPAPFAIWSALAMVGIVYRRCRR